MDRFTKSSKQRLAFTILVVAGFIGNPAIANSASTTIDQYATSGYKLLNQKRFANAEAPLRNAVYHDQIQMVNIRGRLQLISMLEASLMVQKKYAPSDQVTPIDMSHFFTKCENIKKGSAMAEARQHFSAELEVGKDYFPVGVMKDIFATALPVGIDRKAVENFKRTVFIPDANHSSDWCIVFEESGYVKMTMVSSD